MIYKYKCVDCGKENEGTDICFALTELLELNGIDPRLSMIHFEKLDEWAGEVDLYKSKRCRIKITLQEFMVVLGQNFVKHKFQGSLDKPKLDGELQKITNEMMSLKYTELESERGLGRLMRSTVSQAERQKEIRVYKRAIDARFRPQFDMEEEIQKKSEGINSCWENMANYSAFLWIEPLFFEGEREVYSLRYSVDENPVNLKELMAPEEIRGYCPVCGAPVIKGAGKYPHRLVGMIGAQSSGKTSIIISLIDEMVNQFDEYGIECPDEDYLCDSRYYTIGWNLKLFRNGWAVKKTPAVAGMNTFNASMLLQSSSNPQNRQIITFVDIAGELCYDWVTKAWKPSALTQFPLINHCDIYLVCSCIDENSYGEIDEHGIGMRIDSNAVLKIVKGMYEWIDKEAVTKIRAVPPLGIIITKADLTGELAGTRKETPFDTILNSKDKFFHRAEVEKLRDYYMTAQSASIKRPLQWCVKTYNAMEKRTYVSMMSCSALGGIRPQYKYGRMEEVYKEPESIPEEKKIINELHDFAEDMQEKNESVFVQMKKQEDRYLRLYTRFVEKNTEPYCQAMGMDRLWNWLLAVTGFHAVPVGSTENPEILPEGEYLLPHIPSYNDYYRTGLETSDLHRRVFDITEAMDRTQAVNRLFINLSPHDDELYTEYVSVEGGGFFRRRVSPEKRIQVIKELANCWN